MSLKTPQINNSQFSRAFLLKSATLFAIFTALALVAGKAFAYFRCEALSVQASLLDSCLDGFISTINFFAVRHALIPADSDHGFGHGKAEALAGLLQAVFIAASAIWLLSEVVSNVLNPKPIKLDDIAIIVMIAASVLTGILITWQKYVIKQTGSLAISADCLHYKADLLANFGVVISMVATQYMNIPIIDTLAASIFGFYIIKTAWSIGIESFNILMDRELPEEDLEIIRGVLSQFKDRYHISKVKTRSCGQKKFIQMDLYLDPDIKLQSADAIAIEIKEALALHLSKAEITIQKKVMTQHANSAVA